MLEIWYNEYISIARHIRLEVLGESADGNFRELWRQC